MERNAVNPFMICDLRFTISSRCCKYSALAGLLILTAFSTGMTAESSGDTTSVIVVVGAPGQAEFGSNFVRQATLWEKACAQAQTRQLTLGVDASTTNDYDRFKATLADEPKDGAGVLWLVLIGHGTFDGKEARFNLRGPDVSASDLALWLKPFHRPLAIIDTTSSSAPFLNKLSASNRVVIAATRSGHEQNFTRFGQYFAEALTDPHADLDKDGQVSLLEAFLMASRQATEFYKVEGRLATEHALLDDTGDGLGTPADWFHGLRAAKRPRENASVDGVEARQLQLIPAAADQTLTAEQRARRDTLERAVLSHREKKGSLPEDEYYRELELLLLELARLYATNANSAMVQPASR